MRAWTWLVPALALAVLGLTEFLPSGPPMFVGCLLGLIGAVVASVHHAEVVAHRIGEPFGTLVLSISITVIEVALIVTVMSSGGPNRDVLLRDTIFSVVMISCNGVVGLSLLIGALRHREQSFHVLGSNASLASLIALTTLSLVLPAFTTSSPGPTYTEGQLTFASVASLVLWSTFIFVQTVRHRDYFLPVGGGADSDSHAPRPSDRLSVASFAMLIVALVAVIGLAHGISPGIASMIARAGAPKQVLSVSIAMLTLLPESWAAVRAAFANRLQTSLNLALGSALASIGLTIPAVAFFSVNAGAPIELGLASKDLVLLVLTFVVSTITLTAGRTHVLQGVVHLVVFGSFLFFALVP